MTEVSSMTDTGCAMKNIKSLGRRALTLALCLSLVFSAIPGLAAAESLGNAPSSVYASAVRYFAQAASTGASFFTGDTAGTGTVVTAAAGTVWMLVSNNFYTIDGIEYYSVYYNNEIYHVRRTEMTILSDADAQNYIRNNIWKAGSYTTLKQTLELEGDVRVYGLQMALQSLGYYTGVLDGNYGKETDDAVYKFQRANGLSRDGDAGPLTQAALYAKASGTSTSTGSSTGSSTGGSTTTTTTSGTLRTRVSVNLRESASSSSPKLASVPVNSVLTFFNTRVSGNVTWYQVVYGNQNGWLMGTYVTVTSSSTGSSAAGTLVTTDKVNLRKNASQSSARLGVVPQGITMAYSDTSTSGSVTWYKVTYGVNTGWLMGNYVRASGSAGGGSGGGGNTNTGVVTGTVRITKASTRVRATPNGSKTGVVLAIGTVVNMTGSATTAAGYTWYPIITTSGVAGYVRGDCATVVSSGGSGGGDTGTITNPVTSKRFITLPMTTSLFTTSTRPSSGTINVPQGSVVQMVTPETYTGSDGAIYCRLYYNGTSYNALYSDVSGGIMSDSALAAYVVQLWNSGLNDKFYNNGSLVGDVRVYAMQLALYVLGYYTGALDGSYGDSSEAAVKSFQRSQSGLDADGVMGVQTWPLLCARAKAVSNGNATYNGSSGGGDNSGGSGGGSGGGTTVADFGTINQVTKPTWKQADEGNFWPRYSFATVLDVTTGKVFTIYRTGGTNHPDAVTYTTADTQTMCEIVGFTYPNRRPTTAELALIVADSANSNATYTWPDFKGTLTNVASIGGAWDRRPALINVNGQVYAVSIYGWPHSFKGIGANDGLSTQKFPNGTLLYENNNMYGCICIRFYNSTGHGSTVNQAVTNAHNAAADTAYAYAQRNWPSLCK